MWVWVKLERPLSGWIPQNGPGYHHGIQIREETSGDASDKQLNTNVIVSRSTETGWTLADL